MKTKILSILISVFMIIALVSGTVCAEEISGQCGDNAFWEIDGSGTVTISGTGAMKNYDLDELTQNVVGVTVVIRGAQAPTPWRKMTVNKVVIGEGITNIGDQAFAKTNVLSVTLPNNVIGTGERVFENCSNLVKVNLGNGIINLGKGAFQGCGSLVKVDFGTSIQSIGANAFKNTALTDVTIPDTVEILGNAAFASCVNLRKVKIGKKVEVIGASTFSGCKNLSVIDIPKSVVAISENAFQGCESLISVNYEGSREDWANIVLGAGNEILTHATINYGAGSNNAAPVESDEIKVMLDGKQVMFDQKPVIINDRVMVPIRAVAEAMGDSVEWHEDINAALIIHPDRVVGFKTNNAVVPILKGAELEHLTKYYCDVPAQNINGRILTPLRAIGESLDAKVEWDGETRTVYITSGAVTGRILSFSVIEQIRNEIGLRFNMD